MESEILFAFVSREASEAFALSEVCVKLCLIVEPSDLISAIPLSRTA